MIRDCTQAETRACRDDHAPRLYRRPARTHGQLAIGLGRGVAAHYPELDADLLLAGIVLHDIGKIDELRYSRGISYTTEGRLLGHIMIGVTLVREKIRAIPDFPAPARGAGGALDFEPSWHARIWLACAPADARKLWRSIFWTDMDSKMAAIGATLESPAGEDEWTDRNPSLGRALLRADKFQAART